jgi:hypothetical protein
MDNETLLAIRLVIKIVDEILKFFDLSEFFLNTKITNLNQSFLLANSYIYSAQANAMFHIDRLFLVLNSIETLSSEHSAEHHQVCLSLPAVRQVRTYTIPQYKGIQFLLVNASISRLTFVYV